MVSMFLVSELNFLFNFNLANKSEVLNYGFW